MSNGIELITTVANSAATGDIAKSLWEALRSQLKEKGFTDIPVEIIDDEGVKKFIAEKTANISDEDDHAVTVNALATGRHTAFEHRNERRRQARTAFNAALGFSILGVIIVIIGIILLFTQKIYTTGAITAGAGVISKIISVLLFKLSDNANKRYDKVGEDLSRIDLAKEAIEIAKEIIDPTKKDEAIREVISSLTQAFDK